MGASAPIFELNTMTGFVYKWTNTINGKWYIGSHKGTTDDGYRHSSKVVKAAEKKYGREYFIREILFEGDYEKDQIREIVEARFLQEQDAANDPMAYNQTNITGINCFSQEHRNKISQAVSGQNNPSYGRRPSLETRKRISAKMTGKKCGPRSEEWLRRQSKAKKGIVWSDSRRMAYENSSKSLGLQPRVSCPSCNKEGGISLMKRYHFDNCPLRK